MTPTRVSLELGSRWVFAAALDWPGWCRRGKGEQAALDALLDYADRYAAVAGPEFAPGELHVVGRVPGSSTTDFGAPDTTGEWDDEPLPHAEAARLTGLLDACWRAFDAVLASAPAELRKGPRGGGRDRDAIADHVREAERSYTRRIGVRVPPRTPWPAQRAVVVDALRAGAPGGVVDRSLRVPPGSHGMSSTTRGRSRTRAHEQGASPRSRPVCTMHPVTRREVSVTVADGSDAQD